jgi:predicted DNA-binding transcriptional regulator YafY
MSQTERIFHIDREIREKGGASVGEVATRFEVCERQVKRDIEYMRDRLDAPIFWSAARRRYEYSEPWDSLASADEKSFLAFAFIDAILSKYAYVPVLSDDPLSTLEARLPSRYAQIAHKVIYELPDFERTESGIAYLLCGALLDGEALDIEYLDAKGEKTIRIIIPARLVNYSGKWYCVAFDSKSQGLRTFLVSRIKKTERTKSAYSSPSPPSEGEIDAFLSSSYGIFKGKPVGIASLRFYGGAARAVREQVWHREQKVTEISMADGRSALDLSLPVHDWTEILGRALRCGANCEVLSPPEFRASWVEEIRKMRELSGS